jgi:chemotaxis protein methyltransferase CheR
LFTGVADPPLGELAPFETVFTEAGVLYRRPAAGQARPRDPARGEPVEPGAGEAARPSTGSGRAGSASTGSGQKPLVVSLPNHEGGPSRRPSTGSGRAEHRPDQPALARAAAASRNGAWEEVLALGDALLETPEGAALLVRAGANAGDLGRAESLAARAAERHPLAPELHLLQAAVLSELARDAEALAALRRCLYLDRRLAVAHAALGALLARTGDLEGARRAWRNVRRICATLPAGAPLPLGDGQCAGRLSEVASARISILGGGDGR